jgi:transposase
MPGPKAAKVNVSKEAQCVLDGLEKGHKTGQQIAQRARMIRLAAMGKSNAEIGRELKVERLTVKRWRERWVSLEPIPLDELRVEERLEDLPRPGAPARITAEQRCQMEVLACEAPEKYGRPISQWTGREIADELVARQIVETISPRHAERLLKRIVNSTSHESLLAEHREG